jgi:hypothetical protein
MRRRRLRRSGEDEKRDEDQDDAIHLRPSKRKTRRLNTGGLSGVYSEAVAVRK